MAAGMDQDEEVWKRVFQELIQEVKPWHKWTLTLDKGLLPNALQPGWTQYQQWSFARFSCSSCSRSWASVQVQILFHMYWGRKKHRGQVKMRVFTQRCQKCPRGSFEAPEFTQENISRILSNLVFRILKRCYRQGFELAEEIPTVKEISLEGPHDSRNCEACLQGFCAQSGLDLATQSPMMPSLPTPSKDAGEPTCSQPPSRVDTLRAPLVNPRVSDPPKANPKVSHTSKPTPTLIFPTQQGPPMSRVNPKVPDLPKADPKVSHTSKPSTALVVPIDHLPPMSRVKPRVPDLPKSHPKISHTSKPSTALVVPIDHLPPIARMNPKVPDLPKADPKVSHTSKPSTLPTFPTQQVPPLSSLPQGLATRMPSLTEGSTTAYAPTRDTRLKPGRALSSSSSFAKPTWVMSHPASGSPRASTICHVEKGPIVSPSGEDYNSCSDPICACGGVCMCRCILILILAIVVGAIIIKTML